MNPTKFKPVIVVALIFAAMLLSSMRINGNPQAQQHTYYVYLPFVVKSSDTSGTPMPTATPTITPTLDTTPPTVIWIAPVANHQTYSASSGNVQLYVSATDASGIHQVYFKRWDAVNNVWVQIATVTSPPYIATLDVSTLNMGWNQVNADAIDNASNVGSDYIWLYRTAVNTLTPTATPTNTATPTKTLTSTPTKTPTSTPTPYRPGHMWLSPSSGTYYVGNQFTVDVVADSSSAQINGIDVVLDFDKTKLSVVTVTDAVYLGGFWWGTTGGGRFMISAYALVPFTYRQGNFTVAHITFQVLSSGNTPVNFVFTPGSTTDSNLWDMNTVQDVLGNVTNASYSLR